MCCLIVFRGISVNGGAMLVVNNFQVSLKKKKIFAPITSHNIQTQKRRFKKIFKIDDYDSKIKDARKAILRAVPVVRLSCVGNSVVMDASKLMVC